MKRKLPIIQTKFVPPFLKKFTIRKPHVMRKLNEIEHYPLTLIHSGAGYGKSTALSSFIHDHHFTYSWYSIAKSDDDFLPFILHFIHSIRTQIPTFSEKLLYYLVTEQPHNYEEDVPFICSELINEFMKIKQSFFVILDDFHLIEHTVSIKQLLLSLIEYLPDHIHLILSGRTRPTWHLLTELFVKGKLLEVNEKDLAFTEEEIGVLFSDYYHMPLKKTDINQIYKKTEGWIIAIHMVWQKLKAQGNVEKLLEKKLSSMNELFHFLTMEVVEKQPLPVQEFLQKTCIFDELTETLCNELLNINNSGELLEYLVHQHLFLISIEKKQYRYHALFKECLQEKLKENKRLYKDLHLQAANYYLSQGYHEKAFFYLLEIKDYVKTASLLERYGQMMIENGQLEMLLDVLKALPDNLKNIHYMLWFYQGEIYRYRCYYEDALASYERVQTLAVHKEDSIGESLGKEGKARVYLDTVQPGKAGDLLRQAISLIDAHPGCSTEKKVQLYSLMAENLLNLGKAADAENWYNKCKHVYKQMDGSKFEKVEFEARLYLRTGRLFQAKEILESYKREQSKSELLSRSHRTTDLLLAIVNTYIGDGDQAKAYAQESILRASQWKAPFVESVGWTRIGHAVQLLDHYRLHMAEDCYKTSLKITDQLKVRRGRAEPLMGLCLLYGRTDQYELAMEIGKQALLETEKDVWLASFIQLAMGIAAYYGGNKEEALCAFQKSMEHFTECGCCYGMFLSSFWLALIEFEQENMKRFTKFITSFLRKLKQSNFFFFIEQKTLFGPHDLQKMVPLFIEAKKREIEPEIVSAILEQYGYRNLPSHPGYTLCIQTFGEFKVCLGDIEVTENDWKRDKAKELLQLFVTKRKPIPKSEILSLLWGDLNEEAAARDFKVALNALHKTIEPSRKARSSPFFVERKNISYGLNEEAQIEVDAYAFQSLIEQALQEQNYEYAESLLVKALSYYQGDYLPSRRYHDWSLEMRERLLVLFLRGAERLAQIYTTKERYDEAIYWAEKMIEKDVCWEEAYRLLMYCYYRKNNRSYALKLYTKCTQKLQEELGVAPLDETKKMVEMMIGSEHIQYWRASNGD
ncbi:BTAD domain-containing putative transcriptional regulator [Bacillus taeanensis]|uniref:Transcriptional regulator n=1 Tax=Bacillus taeanensis TaxID=273032 RepID=A0A366XS15_9BACI|nr:BTAD domain-containing putative transcriptional regulator [Bacillus taeanensis]RBW68338.1 transcriptional regulator [Bacillus taeanensis]